MFHLQDQLGLRVLGGRVAPKRVGRRHPLYARSAPTGCPSGWCFLLCLDRQWPNLARAMGRPDLVDDPRSAAQHGPRRATGRTDPRSAGLAAFLSRQRAADGGVPRITGSDRSRDGPRARHRPPPLRRPGHRRHVPDPMVGELVIPGFPFKFSAHPELAELVAPAPRRAQPSGPPRPVGLQRRAHRRPPRPRGAAVVSLLEVRLRGEVTGFDVRPIGARALSCQPRLPAPEPGAGRRARAGRAAPATGRAAPLRRAAPPGPPAALRLAPGDRRRAGELGRAQGPDPRPGGAPPGGEGRRPPDRVRRLRGRHPAGEYGGGDVIVWDRGTWAAGRDRRPGCRQSRPATSTSISFGEKLRGRFVLIRRDRRERSGKDQWFLLHKQDAVAEPGWDPEDHPESVKPVARTTTWPPIPAPCGTATCRPPKPKSPCPRCRDRRRGGDREERPAGPPSGSTRAAAGPPPTSWPLSTRSGPTVCGTSRAAELQLPTSTRCCSPAVTTATAPHQAGPHPLPRPLAPFMLPYLVDRPVNLHRFRTGSTIPASGTRRCPARSRLVDRAGTTRMPGPARPSGTS